MATLLIPTDTSQATLGYLLADGTIVGSTSQAQGFGSNGIKADVIVESTSGAGVLIDGASDAVQLAVQGDFLQSSQVFVVEISDGTDIFTVDAVGKVQIHRDGNSTSNNLAFGATSGGDAVLYWDGTDLIIDPTLISAGDVHIKADNAALALGAGSGGDARLYWSGSALRIDTGVGTAGAQFNNFVGISTTPAANTILKVADAFPAATASPIMGASFQPTARPTSGSSYDVTGVFGIAVWQGSGTSTGDSCRALEFTARQNSDRALGDLTGVQIKLQTQTGKTGTLADAFGFVVAKSYAGVKPTNEVIGMDIQDISDSGLATFKGLRIAAQTAATTNIAISQEDTAAENRLGANTSIGADAPPTSTVDINGSLAAATIAKTGAYTAAIGDYFIDCDVSGGAFTVTLPAASGVSGRMYRIKKTDSSGNAVTVDGNSSETIDGATTQVINVQYDSMAIICDGSSWHII